MCNKISDKQEKFFFSITTVKHIWQNSSTRCISLDEIRPFLFSPRLTFTYRSFPSVRLSINRTGYWRHPWKNTCSTVECFLNRFLGSFWARSCTIFPLYLLLFDREPNEMRFGLFRLLWPAFPSTRPVLNSASWYYLDRLTGSTSCFPFVS